MSYRLVVIRDLPHLSRSITDFGSSAGEVWYRGESVHYHNLEPSAYRRDRYIQSSYDIEHRSVTRSRSKFFNIPGTDKLLLNLHWLSYMQHVGVPTRLLDWSPGHNMAIYFAFEDYILKRSSSVGLPCVWAFKPTEFSKALVSIIKKGKWPLGLTRKNRSKLIDIFFSDCRPTDAQFMHEFEQENPRVLDDIYVPFVSAYVNKNAEAQDARFVRFPLLNRRPALFKQHQLNEFILAYPQLADCFAKFIFLNPVAMTSDVIAQNPRRSRVYPNAQTIAEEIKNELFY